MINVFWLFGLHTLSSPHLLVFLLPVLQTLEGEMRKHGWQLPYHPLQVLPIGLVEFYRCSFCKKFRIFYNFSSFFGCIVKVVAVAVFLALGFAFYVFFAPFVGKKMFQYIVMGIYTPLVSEVLRFLLPKILLFSFRLMCLAKEGSRSVPFLLFFRLGVIFDHWLFYASPCFHDTRLFLFLVLSIPVYIFS